MGRDAGDLFPFTRFSGPWRRREHAAVTRLVGVRVALWSTHYNRGLERGVRREAAPWVVSHEVTSGQHYQRRHLTGGKGRMHHYSRAMLSASARLPAFPPPLPLSRSVGNV